MSSPLAMFAGLSSKRVTEKYTKILHKPRKPARRGKRGMWNRKEAQIRRKRA